MILINVSAPEADEVQLAEYNIQCRLKNQTLGTGILYFTANGIYWIDNEGKGFHLPYIDIYSFAVSRNVSESYPHPCLLVMSQTIDQTSAEEERSAKNESVNDDDKKDNENDGEGSSDEDSNSNADQDDPVTCPLQLIPKDEDILQVLNHMMLKGMQLSPIQASAENGQGDSHENEDDEAYYEDAETDESNLFHNCSSSIGIHGGGDNVIEEDLDYELDEDVSNEQPMDVGQFEDADQEH